MGKSHKRNKGSVLLEKYLEDNSLTASDFARSVGATKSYICMLKRGQVTPGLSLAAKIEDATEIPCRAWTEAS